MDKCSSAMIMKITIMQNNDRICAGHANNKCSEGAWKCCMLLSPFLNIMTDRQTDQPTDFPNLIIKSSFTIVKRNIHLAL